MAWAHRKKIAKDKLKIIKENHTLEWCMECARDFKVSMYPKDVLELEHLANVLTGASKRENYNPVKNSADEICEGQDFDVKPWRNGVDPGNDFAFGEFVSYDDHNYDRD